MPFELFKKIYKGSKKGDYQLILRVWLRLE